MISTISRDSGERYDQITQKWVGRLSVGSPLSHRGGKILPYNQRGELYFYRLLYTRLN